MDYEVFFNTKDQSWQAVAGDGQGVIIINEVTKDRADKIYNRIGRFQAEPQKLSLDQLKKVELRRLRQLEEHYQTPMMFFGRKVESVSIVPLCSRFHRTRQVIRKPRFSIT